MPITVKEIDFTNTDRFERVGIPGLFSDNQPIFKKNYKNLKSSASDQKKRFTSVG